MTTEWVWDGSPLSHSRPKIYGYFSSHPKPGVGRVCTPIPSPSRPGYVYAPYVVQKEGKTMSYNLTCTRTKHLVYACIS